MTRKELEKQDIQRKRQFTVRKANEIIQHSHSVMTAQQLDIVAYLVSKVKPQDEPQQTYYFSIQEFCAICNKSRRSGYYYQSIKDDISAIASVNVWVEQDNGKERLVHWLDDVMIDKGNGIIEISFHKSIYPYIFELKDRLTFYPLEYYTVLKSTYAKLLYDILKSIERLNGEKTLNIDYLKKQLGAENYTRFPDFRRFVLDKAVSEINLYTDIEVIYNPKKINSRAITHIGFNIQPVKVLSTAEAARKYNRELELDDDTRKSAEEWEERNQKQIEEMEARQREIEEGGI